jgi:mRNA-degrading endonuclease toxin of MazEF toxin-antitoxin module
MPFPYHVRSSDFTFDRQLQWGDVYWYDFGVAKSNQDKTIAEPHLAVIVNNPQITWPGVALIMSMTGAEHKHQGYVFQVLVTRRECSKLDKDSLVKTDQIYSVPTKPGLPDQYFLTQLEMRIMKRIYEKLVLVLNFNEVVK